VIVITGKSATKINRNLRVNGVECGKAHLEFLFCGCNVIMVYTLTFWSPNYYYGDCKELGPN